MVPNTGAMGRLQRVMEAFEIISKYLIVSLGRKSIHSVYWIFRRINDHPPPRPKMLRITIINSTFFFMIHFLNSERYL